MRALLQHLHRHRHNERGVTLIELVIGMSLASAVLAIGGGSLVAMHGNNAAATVRQDIQQVQMAVPQEVSMTGGVLRSDWQERLAVPLNPDNAVRVVRGGDAHNGNYCVEVKSKSKPNIAQHWTTFDGEHDGVCPAGW